MSEVRLDPQYDRKATILALFRRSLADASAWFSRRREQSECEARERRAQDLRERVFHPRSH